MSNELLERIDNLEKENRQLKKSVQDLASIVQILWQFMKYGNKNVSEDSYELFKIVEIDSEAFECLNDKISQIKVNMADEVK